MSPKLSNKVLSSKSSPTNTPSKSKKKSRPRRKRTKSPQKSRGQQGDEQKTKITSWLIRSENVIKDSDQDQQDASATICKTKALTNLIKKNKSKCAHNAEIYMPLDITSSKLIQEKGNHNNQTFSSKQLEDKKKKHNKRKRLSNGSIIDDGDNANTRESYKKISSSESSLCEKYKKKRMSNNEATPPKTKSSDEAKLNIHKQDCHMRSKGKNEKRSCKEKPPSRKYSNSPVKFKEHSEIGLNVLPSKVKQQNTTQNNNTSYRDHKSKRSPGSSPKKETKSKKNEEILKEKKTKKKNDKEVKEKSSTINNKSSTDKNIIQKTLFDFPPKTKSYAEVSKLNTTKEINIQQKRPLASPPKKKKKPERNEEILKSTKTNKKQDNIDNYITHKKSNINKRCPSTSNTDTIIKNIAKCSSKKKQENKINTTKEDHSKKLKKLKSASQLYEIASYGVVLPTFEQIMKFRKKNEEYKEKSKIFEQCDRDILEISVPQLTKVEQLKDAILDCKHLSLDQLDKEFEKHKSTLKRILNGYDHSDRHQRYHNFNSKWRMTTFDLTYSPSLIAFSFDQKDHLLNKMTLEFEADNKLIDYFLKVLLPELCLLIFKDIHDMTKTQANRYLEKYPVHI